MSLAPNTFITVTVGDNVNDMPVEDNLHSLHLHLVDGEYNAFYWDEETDEDIYGTIKVENGTVTWIGEDE